MKLITTLPKESILDVCLSQCGSLEAIFDIIKLNALPDINLLPGMQLIIPKAPINKVIVDWYKANNIRPTTGVDASFYIGDFNNDFNNDFNI